MFEKVKSNIKAYVEASGHNQIVGIHNNINMFNVLEAADMVVLAKDLGVDFVDFNPTYGIEGVCVDSTNVHIFEEAQNKIKEKAAELEMNVTFMRDLTLGINVPKEPELIQVSLDNVVKLADHLWIEPEQVLELVENNKEHVSLFGFKPF
jgi:fructose-specific phosphotransferase system component IIB